jgi:hypothetical protein
MLTGQWRISRDLFFSGDQIERDWEEERCIQRFGGKLGGKGSLGRSRCRCK